VDASWAVAAALSATPKTIADKRRTFTATPEGEMAILPIVDVLGAGNACDDGNA
jgi:hypothetical protein